MRHLLGLILMVALLWAASPAQAVEAARVAERHDVTSESAAAWLDEAVPRVFEPAPYTGLAVSVVADGQPVLTEGLGAARQAPHTPLDPAEHLFRVGSVSKVFNALAVMQLVERGDVDLDADVNTYVDLELELPLGPVTLRQLLSHTAGFEERMERVFVGDVSKVTDLRTYLSEVQPRQVYEPGTVTAYSNYSAALAGHVVERVSGQEWADYVEQHVIQPLGMHSTSAGQPLPEPLADRLAWAYPGGGTAPQDFEFLSGAPAGVVSSTATDMALFAQFLLAGDDAVLGEEAHRAWLAGEPMAELGGLGRGGFVSLGLAHAPKHETWGIGHGGDTIAHHASLVVWPERDLAIFAVATDSALVWDLTDDFFSEFVAEATAPGSAPGEAGDQVLARDQAQAVAEHTWTNSRRNDSAALTISNPTMSLTAHDDGDVSLQGQRYAWGDDWHWVDPDSGEHLTARAVDGRVEAVQFTPYMTFIPGGPTTKTLGITAVTGLLVLIVAGASAGITWVVRRRRYGHPRPRASAVALAGRLAGWTPVLFIVAIGLKLLSLRGLIEAFVLPGPRIPDITGNLTLEVLGSVVMAVALLATVALLVPAVGHARGRRPARAAGWAVAFAGGVALVWALAELNLLFSPMLI